MFSRRLPPQRRERQGDDPVADRIHHGGDDRRDGGAAVTKRQRRPRSAEGEHEAILYRNGQACGVERWWIKTGIDRDARSVNARVILPTTIFHLRSLPAPDYLPSSSRLRPTETTVFRVSARLIRFKQEADSDYHLVLSDTGGRTMIGEIPAPYCVGSSSPFLAAIRSARSTFDRRYHGADTWRRLNIAVTATGVGFFDFKHGQSGVAPNAIELHPVLGIAFGKSSKPISPPSGQKPPKPGNFSLRVWVTPNPMPYGAYPTLHAQTVAGATCTASVVYSTGRAPRSFDGSARTAGRTGTVSWSWHEETTGSGGIARVTCSYRGASRTATASFTVTRQTGASFQQS